MQQILRLIETRGDIPDSAHMMNSDCVPWIELVGKVKEFITAPSPRLRVTHLQYKFMPLALSQKKGKVSSLPECILLKLCTRLYTTSQILLVILRYNVQLFSLVREAHC